MTLADLIAADGDDAVAIAVHAQPGAGRTHVVGRHGDALKVRVAAPPEQGRANEALVKLLAEVFGVADSAVELRSGAASRAKRFRIAGVDTTTAADLLDRAIEAGKAPGQQR